MRPSVILFILYSAAIAVIASLQNESPVTARLCCKRQDGKFLGVSEGCCKKKAKWDEGNYTCLLYNIKQAVDYLDCCLKESGLKVFLCGS